MDIEQFWKRVKFLIKAHKTTQENVAGLIGVSFSTFRNWIYYNRSPDIQIVINLSIVLGVTLDNLVFNEDWNSIEKQKERLKERKDAAMEIGKLAKNIIDKSGTI